MRSAVSLLLLLAALLAGCSTAHMDAYRESAAGYWQRAERNFSDAVSRAAGALGVGEHPHPMVVANANVNVREGPGTNYDTIGAIAAGNTVPVVDEKEGWYWIRYNSGHGWVKSSYFKQLPPQFAETQAGRGSQRPQEAQSEAVDGGTTKQALAAQTTLGAPATRPHGAEADLLAAESPGAASVHATGTHVASAQSTSRESSSDARAAEHVTNGDAETAHSLTPTAAWPAQPPSTTNMLVSRGPQERMVEEDAPAASDTSRSAQPTAPSAEASDDDALAAATAGTLPTERDDSVSSRTAANLSGDVDVAGMRFQWGMSPEAAAERYGSRAQRVEPNGAVWLSATNVGAGVSVPVEWFDLRFCKQRLCGVHHVVNDVTGDKKIGDSLAEKFVAEYGAPTADFWTDFGYGRLRMRTWRTPFSRIRLSHQEAQTYVAVDYEPLGAPKAPPRGPGGTIARDN